MKKIFIVTGAALAAIILTALLNKKKAYHAMLNVILDGDVPKITVSKAAKGMKNYLFLDTRTEIEYQVSHLANARFVDYKNFNIASAASVSKEQPIVVYCTVGKRSEDVTAQLIKAGFKNAQNLYGGIIEWVNEGNTVYDRQGPTKKVHPYNSFWAPWLERGEKVFK